MAISFVKPSTVRLDLSGDDWVEVKQRLSYGEAQRLSNSPFGKMQMGGTADTAGEVGIDLAAYNLERMLTYIVDWSAKNPDGSPMKVSRDAFSALDGESAREINEALDGHIEANQKNVNTDAKPIASVSLSAVS